MAVSSRIARGCPSGQGADSALIRSLGSPIWPHQESHALISSLSNDVLLIYIKWHQSLLAHSMSASSHWAALPSTHWRGSCVSDRALLARGTVQQRGCPRTSAPLDALLLSPSKTSSHKRRWHWGNTVLVLQNETSTTCASKCLLFPWE